MVGERPDGALLPVLRLAINVRVLGARLLAMSLGLPALIAVDELREEGGLLGVACDELVLQELLGRGPESGVLVEAGLHELLEGLAVLALQCGRAVLGNQEQDAHGMEVRVWRLPLASSMAVIPRDQMSALKS